MLDSLLRRIVRLLSRVVAIFIMPAQLPGNAVAMFDLLTTAPLSAIKRWNLRTIGALLRQVVRSEKLTIPNDAILRRFVTQRQRYLDRGWLEQARPVSARRPSRARHDFPLIPIALESPSLPPTPHASLAQPITTADGVMLDACIKLPPRRASGERWVLFVGGNFQRRRRNCRRKSQTGGAHASRFSRANVWQVRGPPAVLRLLRARCARRLPCLQLPRRRPLGGWRLAHPGTAPHHSAARP